MSHSLQVRWQNQLSVVQTDSSRQSHVEARVLRFLLSRYPRACQEAPLPNFPLYEGESAHGRARALLSPHEQEQRLAHIKQGNVGKTEGWALIENNALEWVAWQEIRQRRKWAAFGEFGQTPPSPEYIPQWLLYDLTKPLSHIMPRRVAQTVAKTALVLEFIGQILNSRR